MTEKKITYVQALDVVLDGGDMTQEVIDKLCALRETLAKKSASKSSAAGKPSKAAIENEALGAEVLDWFEANPEAKVTATMLSHEIEALSTLSNQKITRVLKGLYDAKRIGKVIEKRVSYYVADPDLRAE